MSAAGSMSTSASDQVLDGAAIRQHASDISAHAARLEILLLEAVDKLDGIKPRTRPRAARSTWWSASPPALYAMAC